jgi:hypothetical protein
MVGVATVQQYTSDQGFNTKFQQGRCHCKLSFHFRVKIFWFLLYPLRIPGLPVLEDLISKYPHNLLLDDFNMNMLEDTQEKKNTEFLSRLGRVSLCVASKEATHF